MSRKTKEQSKLKKIAILLAILGAAAFIFRNVIIDTVVGIAAIFVDLFVVTNFYLFFSLIAFISIVGFILVVLALRKQR